MTLSAWVPPMVDAGLAKNGYALLSDLGHPRYLEMMQFLERFQVEFLATTRPIWRRDFAFTGDTLYNFSRQWEYPYAWQNIGTPAGRVLDAGSGITFFPFLMAAAGWRVECCDLDPSLGAVIERAASSTGYPIGFSASSIADMGYEDEAFDAVVCISVLEHTGDDRAAAIREFRRVLKPRGRLVITCDLSLGRDGDIILEDLSVVLRELQQHFRFIYPLDLRRSPDLLTSDHFLRSERWRIPWRGLPLSFRNLAHPRGLLSSFRSIAILGITAERN